MTTEAAHPDARLSGEPVRLSPVPVRLSKDPVRLPLGRLAVAELAAVTVAAGLVGVGVWPFNAAAALAALPAAGVMAFGVVCGLAFLRLMPPRPLGYWAMPALFAGVVRLGAGAGAGLWAYFAFDPSRLAFWGAVLATGIAALIAELAVLMPVLSGKLSSTPGRHSGTRQSGTRQSGTGTFRPDMNSAASA